jgi:hypothetical protein
VTTIKEMCRDHGERPGCLGEADDRYTMRFDDIGEPPLYWCARCGPEVAVINAALTEALETRGPEFQKELAGLIDQAMQEVKESAS